jgi:hypothetical protein
MTTAVAPAFNPAGLVKTTQLLEKLVTYIPQYGWALNLIPGAAPFVAIAISAEPLAEIVLKMVEDIEASQTNGFNPVAIFQAIETHFPAIAAAAAKAKITLPTLPFPLPFPLPPPVVPAGPGVTSAEQAAVNFQAPQ